jgi:hypothetical protein
LGLSKQSVCDPTGAPDTRCCAELLASIGPTAISET